MKKLNVVMFNMSKYSDWQKGVNRNYHILHNLVKDERIHKVIAVDFLPFNAKRALKTYVTDHILHDARGTVLYGDLTSRCWQVTSKILVYSTIDSILNKQRIITELKRILHEQEMEDNLVVWNYNPLYVDYLGQFPGAAYVFDAVDNWAAHSSYKKYKNQILENYKQIGEESDHVFTVADELRLLFNNQSHVRWIPNGVDIDHFRETTAISDRLEGIPKPIIGFLGVLQDRIDIDLVEYVAKMNPQASVALVGPVWKGFERERLEKVGNVYFPGASPYNEIPKFYNGFDVGIIPYKLNEFIRSTNSMKFYEYLAAGLPVVTTRCPGADQFENVLYIADSKEEFNAHIQSALSEDRGSYRERRLSVLEGKTWRDRIEDIFTQLGA